MTDTNFEKFVKKIKTECIRFVQEVKSNDIDKLNDEINLIINNILELKDIDDLYEYKQIQLGSLLKFVLNHIIDMKKVEDMIFLINKVTNKVNIDEINKEFRSLFTLTKRHKFTIYPSIIDHLGSQTRIALYGGGKKRSKKTKRHSSKKSTGRKTRQRK